MVHCVQMPLRVGLQLPEVERVVGWAEYLAMARRAEEVGFDSLWLGDHLLYRDDGRPERGPHECWTLLAALAASTTTVELGPLVACLAFHPPGVLAKMAATVDEVSGGRLVLGVGAGWNKVEFDAFGLSFETRYRDFVAAFDTVRRLLAGERVGDAVLLPEPRRTPPPTMIGSIGERVLRATLPHVDRWNTWYDWYGNNADGLANQLATIRRLCEEVGRDPATLMTSACVQVVLDPARADRPIDPAMPPFDGSAQPLRQLGALVDELILIVSPNTLESIDRLAETVAGLKR